MAAGVRSLRIDREEVEIHLDAAAEPLWRELYPRREAWAAEEGVRAASENMALEVGSYLCDQCDQ